MAIARLIVLFAHAVLFSCCYGFAGVSSRSLVEASSNPIRRVVTLLQKMAKKVEAEGEEEKALYEKFSCYCTTGSGDLAKSIAESNAKVPQVQSDITASESELAQLQQDLKGHQEDRSTAKTAMAAATAQRESENKAFLATSGEYTSYISALKSAIPAIQKGMAGFLQSATKASAQLLRRAVADSNSVTDYDRQMLTTFLDTNSHGSDTYVPASGEIVGILEQIQEDFEKSLAEVEATEAEAVKLHEELMAAKTKQVQSLTDSIETKTVRVGDLQVDIVNMKNDLTDTEAALIDNQKMSADLKGNCEAKAAEWEERKKLRAEELVAIHDTIKVLNDDDALDLFKKTLPSSSLLQLSFTAKQVQRRALQIVDAARKPKGLTEPRLDFLAVALSGKQVDFSKVIKMIEDMVAILAKEQADDEHKLEYCQKQIDLAEDKGKELSKKIEDLDVMIADKEELIETVAAELKELTAGIAALDKSVTAAKDQRVKEHSEYLELIKSDSAAKELLAYAKNRLNKFYNPKLYETTTTPALSREDEIYTNLGGSLAPAALVQVSLHARQAAPPPPETWSAYSTKGEETTGVISMIDLLIRDLDREMTEAKTEEQNAQKAYETMTVDAAAKRAGDMKLISEKEGTKADAEMSKTAAAESEDVEKKELMATKQYEMELHQECDWLMQNFDLRKEARAGESESLKEAKAVLAGADFSLSQQHALASAARLRGR